MKHVSIEREYCGKCRKVTSHEVIISRDASKPSRSFIEMESEGYANNADCVFYANGDSEYQFVCRECWNSFTTV